MSKSPQRSRWNRAAAAVATTKTTTSITAVTIKTPTEAPILRKK
jgi:hypothetical protein